MAPKSPPKGQSLILLLLAVYCCRHVAFGANTVTKNKIFRDPQVENQDWIFQMINIYPVWEQGYFGNGIRVRVNDLGIDVSHDEFQGRFDLDASCSVYNAPYNNDTGKIEQHGTTVASIIGGAGNNSQCGTGIAPAVKISSCVVVGDNPDPTVYDNTVLAYKFEDIDISQNAYGYFHCRRSRRFSGDFRETPTCPFNHFPNETIIGGKIYDFAHPCEECEFPSETLSYSCNRAIRIHCLYHFLAERDVCLDLTPELAQGGQCTFLSPNENRTKSIEIGATQGRNGKGIIFVFSSGNDGLGDTNFDGSYQYRYVIMVGSVGRDSIQTQYSRGGASLFLTAPSGDIESNGTQPVAQAGGGCTDAGTGTSYSAATVSAIIALMLEANPDLTWRDIQGILATTSKPVFHTDIVDGTEMMNGAGLFHSNSHGFGIIDAFHAVTAARIWELYGEERHIRESALNLNLPIGDDPNDPTIVEFVVEPSETMIVENVVVSLYLQHLSRGHLMITLTSPDGTVSTLTPGSRPENGQLEKDETWELRTVRSWGETAEGTWKLSIADVEEGDVSSCIDYANFTISALNQTFDCAFLEVIPLFYEDDFLDMVSKLFDEGVADALQRECCACGGGTTVTGNCMDEDGSEALCNSEEISEYCVDGSLIVEFMLLQVEDEHGRTAQDSCCVLGGGITIEDTTSFQDQLNGWTLDIYGHSSRMMPSPTLMVSGSPSFNPSSSPVSETGVPSRPPAFAEPTNAVGESSSSVPSLLTGVVISTAVTMLTTLAILM